MGMLFIFTEKIFLHMKNRIILIAVVALLSINVLAQTAGDFNFTVTTVNNNKKYSPKNVLAIWIETGSGTFVKTLKLNAASKKQYLYSWIASSSQNTTDAITGSTLSSHTSHNVSWNGTDISGSLVDDGNYKVIIEYTSEHAQGPKASFTFNKSNSQVSLQPSNETYFNNISLSFTPSGATWISGFNTNVNESLVFYPNPVLDKLNLEFRSDKIEKDISISLYDTNMRLIKLFFRGQANEGMNQYNFDLSSAKLVSGSYFIVISNQHSIVARRLLKE
jgi:hypothetical protein